jgi:hypothetical protein
VAGNGKRVKNAETCMSEKINELQPNEAAVWERKIRQRHYLEKAPRRKFFRGTRVKKDEIISA